MKREERFLASLGMAIGTYRGVREAERRDSIE
jgi:hypothetical protein